MCNTMILFCRTWQRGNIAMTFCLDTYDIVKAGNITHNPTNKNIKEGIKEFLKNKSMSSMSVILTVKVWTPWKSALNWRIVWFPLLFISRINSNIVDIHAYSEMHKFNYFGTDRQNFLLTYLLTDSRILRIDN